MRLIRKIGFLVLIVLLNLFLNQYIYSQEFSCKKISIGIDAQYLIPSGDLRTYWGNSFGVGFVGQYNFSEIFTFEGGVTVSPFKANQDEINLKLPDFVLINMPIGIKYNVGLLDGTFLTINPGLQNNMFLFTGEAADIIKENDIEHEFGLFIAIGFVYKFSEVIKIELYIKSQSIFSYPDSIPIDYFGVKIFLL